MSTKLRSTLLVFLLCAGTVAQAAAAEERAMNDPEHKAPQIPPEVARYLRGAGAENLQFDFLIGDWNVKAARYKPDGSVLLEYQATWSARYMNDKRMVMDDFKALSPAGGEISSFVTLRTYSEATRRWEITGLAALQPAMNGEWFGEWKDGEMHLDASGKGPGGQSIWCAAWPGRIHRLIG